MALIRCTLLFLFCVQQVYAVSTTGHVSVNILNTLDLAEVKEVDFGALTNENGACTITSSGTKEGSDGSSCSGEGQLGEFYITGAEGQAVSITVTPGESISGVTFTPELYSAATTILTNGATTALVGGVLNIDNAISGSHALTYIISINYN